MVLNRQEFDRSRINCNCNYHFSVFLARIIYSVANFARKRLILDVLTSDPTWVNTWLAERVEKRFTYVLRVASNDMLISLEQNRMRISPL